jgi:imidazolonepropionase
VLWTTEAWSLNSIDSVVFTNACLATFATDAPYGIVERGAIAVAAGRIAWVGPASTLPTAYSTATVEDLDGRLVTPALVDCHTHLVFGGHRAREFEMRLTGASYEQISRAGGGIRSTVSATRAATEDALLAAALPRVDALMAEGVATLEVKSGYGLDLDTEARMLRVARRIADVRDVTVKTTFLGAHAIAPEYEGRADAYVDFVAGEVLPVLVAEGLVDAVDAFCEGIAFTPQQVARVFDAARSCGLPVKLHAEQLSDLKGARLAASHGALSADHLEYLDPADAPALAASGTVAVLLPGAFYFLRETRLPPVEALRTAGVPMAIATDCNPGSSPLASLLLAVNMACTLFRLTPEEALAGVTREAARALGLADECGTIEAGKRADLAVWDVASPAELAYRIGFNPLIRRIRGAPPVSQGDTS